MKFVIPFNLGFSTVLLWVFVFSVGATIEHNNKIPVVSGLDGLTALVLFERCSNFDGAAAFVSR